MLGRVPDLLPPRTHGWAGSSAMVGDTAPEPGLAAAVLPAGMGSASSSVGSCN